VNGDRRISVRPDEATAYLIYLYSVDELARNDVPWKEPVLKTLQSFFESPDMDHATIAAGLIDRLRGKGLQSTQQEQLERDWSELLMVDFLSRESTIRLRFPMYLSLSREWSAIFGEQELSNSFDLRLVDPISNVKPKIVGHVEIKEIPEWGEFIKRKEAIKKTISKATEPSKDSQKPISLYEEGDDMSLALRMRESFEAVSSAETQKAMAFQLNFGSTTKLVL